MKDWVVRALKTFIQAFLGVLIPEIVILLLGGFPEDISAWWAVLSPVVAALLAAGIWRCGTSLRSGWKIYMNHRPNLNLRV